MNISFADFDRPSILSCVDLPECFSYSNKVGARVHHIPSQDGSAEQPETSILHGLHSTPLYFVRCCFLSDWTFLVCL